MTTLSSLCELIIDCEHKTAPTVENGYPLIRTPDIGIGRLHIEGASRVDEATYEQWTKRAAPREGDLILAREAPVGNIGIIKSGVRPVLGQRTVLIRPKTDILDSGYLNYLLSSPPLRGWMIGVANGATVPHLNMSDIRSMEIPVMPSIDTQRKIASVLMNYDDLIENNNRRIKLLEEMAQRIYREWFVDFRYPGHEAVSLVDSELGLIPEGWNWKQLRDIADEVRISVDPSTIDPGTPYVGLEHMPERSIALSEWGTAGSAGSRKYRFLVGDVLFGKIRPYFHKVSVPPVEGICSTDAIVIRNRTPGAYGLVLAVVSSEAFVSEAVQSSQGTKMPRANWGVLEKHPVAIAPQALLERFNSVASDTVSQIHRMVNANRNLRSTRELLLPRLISGEIDVTNLDIALVENAA